MPIKTKIITSLFLLSFFFFTSVQAQESKPEPDQKIPAPDSGAPSIQNITFDKLSYLKGETAKVSFTYVVGSNDTAALDLIIKLKDESNNICSAPLEKQLTKDNAGLMNLEMTMDKDCVNFRSEISVKNEGEGEWLTNRPDPAGYQKNMSEKGIGTYEYQQERAQMEAEKNNQKYSKKEDANSQNEKQKESKNNDAKIALFALMVIIPIALLIGYFIKRKIDARRMLVMFCFFAFLSLGLLLGRETKAAFCQIPNTDKWVADGASAIDSVYHPGDTNSAHWWSMRATCEGGTWHHYFDGGWPHAVSFASGFTGGNGSTCTWDGNHWWYMCYYVQSSSSPVPYASTCYSPETCSSVYDEWGGLIETCTPGGDPYACTAYISCPNGFVVRETANGGCGRTGGSDGMDSCYPRCIPFTTVDPVVNGTCNPLTNGGTFPVAPSTNLCSTGTPSVVSGTGPWTWTCAGAGGGTTASCSANKTCVPTYSGQSCAYTNSIECGTSGTCGETNAITARCWAKNSCTNAIVERSQTECGTSCVNSTTTCPSCLKIDSYKEVSP